MATTTVGSGNSSLLMSGSDGGPVRVPQQAAADVFAWELGQLHIQLGNATTDMFAVLDSADQNQFSVTGAGDAVLENSLAIAGASIGSHGLAVTGTADFSGAVSAATGSSFGNIALADGSITSGGNDIDFGAEGLTSTGAVNFGAATVDSLDASSGGITNAGAISGATTLVMSGALTGLTTIDASGSVTAGSLISDSLDAETATSLAIGAATATAITLGAADCHVTITGNLTVSGSTVTHNVDNVSVEDSLIQLANGNDAADALDIGLVGLYDTSGSLDLYGGLFRDATDGSWNFFKDSQEDLSATNVVNKAATGYAAADVVMAGLTASTGDFSGAVGVDGQFDVNGNLTISTAGALSGATTGAFSGLVTAGSFNDGTATYDAGVISSGVSATFSGLVTAGSFNDGTATYDAGVISSGVSATFSGLVTAGSFNDGTATYDAGVISSGVSATFSGLVTAGSFNDGVATYDAGVISSGVSATFSGLVTAGSLNDGIATYDAGVISAGVSASFSGEVAMGSLDLNGNGQIDGTITVGVDDTGYDVKFFGATASKFMLWDQSMDQLYLPDDTSIGFGNAEGSADAILQWSSVTGGILLNNSNDTGITQMMLGTASSATSFQVIDSATQVQFKVSGDGFMSLDGGIAGQTAIDRILDEDDLVSDSAVALATQQSIKAYVASQITAATYTWDIYDGTTTTTIDDEETLTVAGQAGGIAVDVTGNTLTYSLVANNTVLTNAQNLVESGALAAGSIAPGFGTIDTNSLITATGGLTLDGGAVAFSGLSSFDVDSASVFSEAMTFDGGSAKGIILNDDTEIFFGSAGADGSMKSDGSNVVLAATADLDLSAVAAEISANRSAPADGVGFADGDILAFDSTGDLVAADANLHDFALGVALSTKGVDATGGKWAAFPGQIVKVSTDLSVATGLNAAKGTVLYMSETAGDVTNVAPTTVGSSVIRLGQVWDLGTTAGDGYIVWQPQYLFKN